MGLVPEFFMLLGIDIFAAMSLLSALLGEDIPRSVRWLFQGAAAVGLGQLLVSLVFINNHVLPQDPTDPTRFWISVVYLAAAISNVIGLNVYLVVVRRKIALASIFSGTVTVPIFVISALFVSSFRGSGGVSFTPASIVMLVVPAIVVGLSVFGFLREAFKHISNAPGAPGISLPLDLPSVQGEEWEESPAKEEDEE
jgi:hypothetical protein